mmetsp:Transcript_20265/g.36774  ORF Transcript_20265/g.36774 Transcript_20265/m.36774 type:complete len:724 (-) Transcript_20265:64-2235(-)
MEPQAEANSVVCVEAHEPPRRHPSVERDPAQSPLKEESAAAVETAPTEVSGDSPKAEAAPDEEEEEEEEEDAEAGDHEVEPEAEQPEPPPLQETAAEATTPAAVDADAPEEEEGPASQQQSVHSRLVLEDVNDPTSNDPTASNDPASPTRLRPGPDRLSSEDFLEAGGLVCVAVKTNLAAYLSMDAAVGCFRASSKLRTALSSHVSAQIVPYVTLSGSPPANDREIHRRLLKVKRRMAQSPVQTVAPLRLYVFFAFREKPLKVGVVVRKLSELAPMIAWPEAHLSFKCCGNADMFDIRLRRSIGIIAHSDVDLFMDNPFMMRKVTQVTLNTAEVLHLPEDATFPQVEFLKVICYETYSAREVLTQVLKSFMNINRLHVVIVPAALAVISGPGFVAPRDFRLSLTRTTIAEQDENVFVTSHLFNLPFSWSGAAFRNVIRLQLMQLHQESFGKSLESLIQLLQGMPHLKRLGTVSIRAVELFDILRDDCQLEELVILMEVIDTYKLFSLMLSLERWRRGISIRRLAVHYMCVDGVPRLPVDVESAYCAGWLSMASLLQRGGHVAFSVGHPQLQETALLQLPWLLPGQFCYDPVAYRWPDKLPLCTPLDRPLQAYGLEGIKQPSGILVRGRAILGQKEEAEAASLGMSIGKAHLSTNVSPSRLAKAVQTPHGSFPMSPTLESHGRLGHSFKKGSIQLSMDTWTNPAEEWREMSLKEAVAIMRAHAA